MMFERETKVFLIPEFLKQIKVLNEFYCFLVSIILKQNYKIDIALINSYKL